MYVSGLDHELSSPITSTQTDGITISPRTINNTVTPWGGTAGVLQFLEEVPGGIKVEWIYHTGATTNADNTVTLTGVTRGLSTSANDLTGSTGQAFTTGTKVRAVVDHRILNAAARTDEAKTFTEKQSFDGGIQPPVVADETERDVAFPTPWDGLTVIVDNEEQVYYNGTWNVSGTSSTPSATDSVEGTVELATDTEVRNEAAGAKAIPASSTAVLKDDKIVLKDAVELTVSSGAVTVEQPYHTVDTEGDAATDDLETITAQEGAGEMIILRAEDSARTVVVKSGTGNILTVDGNDLSLDDTEKTITLLNDGTNWKEVNRAVPITSSSPETAILQSTRSTATATGTVSLAHGLSGTPDLVIVNMNAALSSVDFPLSSQGVSDGVTNSCISVYDANGTNNVRTANVSGFSIMYNEDDVGGGAGLNKAQKASITMDGTNVNLVWTKVGSPTTTNMHITLTVIKF